MHELDIKNIKNIKNNIFAIDKLIPQQQGMKLIDNMIKFTEDQIICESVITEDNIFFNQEINGVYSWIGVEFMAQTICAYSGCSRYKNNPQDQNISKIKKPPIGFLLSVRNFSTKLDYFKCNDKLIIKAEKIYLDDGVGVFMGEILINTKIIASAKINTYEPSYEKAEQILKGNNKI